VIEPAPGAARETKSSFQAGYVGFDTGPEVFQLALHPAALDHGIDCEGTFDGPELTNGHRRAAWPAPLTGSPLRDNPVIAFDAAEIPSVARGGVSTAFLSLRARPTAGSVY